MDVGSSRRCEAGDAMGRSASLRVGTRTGSQGFTLIELLVVVLIIALLAALVLPRLDDARARAHLTSIANDFRNLSAAQERYYQTNMQYTADLSGLDFTPSGGVLVQVTEASAQGWAAVGTHQALEADRGCGIYLGNAIAPPLPNGQPHPSGPGVTECVR
jgi:prepilin-type N-terminal cleavage/methylation domain-containing protein